jgi:tight adherence protein C
MNMMFVLFVVALFMAMIFLMVRAKIRRNNARERLLYAFESRADVPVEELNLSAGDYGLEGGARFLYFLTQFLSSPGGYLGVFALGAALGALLKIVLHLDKFSYVMIGILAGAILMVGSNIYIAAKRKERVRKIRYELPNALQSIVAVMESGLAFESALQHVVRESGTHHPLYFDLQVVLDAMQQGRRRNDALKLWATRANERSVSDVTAAMIQADQTGAAIGGVLRHHATTQLKEIEAELLKKAERIPIYMIMPMMICILPPIFLVAVGPSVIRIFRMFEVIMSRS